jgi:hypothetical protein
MMPKNKKELIEVNEDAFIFFHDLNASIYIATTTIDGHKIDNIMVRLEEGRFKGTILKISNIRFDESKPEEKTVMLLFDMDVLADPNENKRINRKYINTIAKNIMTKILDNAVRQATENNDDRNSNS